MLICIHYTKRHHQIYHRYLLGIYSIMVTCNSTILAFKGLNHTKGTIFSDLIVLLKNLIVSLTLAT